MYVRDKDYVEKALVYSFFSKLLEGRSALKKGEFSCPEERNAEMTLHNYVHSLYLACFVGLETDQKRLVKLMRRAERETTLLENYMKKQPISIEIALLSVAKLIEILKMSEFSPVIAQKSACFWVLEPNLVNFSKEDLDKAVEFYAEQMRLILVHYGLFNRPERIANDN